MLQQDWQLGIASSLGCWYAITFLLPILAPIFAHFLTNVPTIFFAQFWPKFWPIFCQFWQFLSLLPIFAHVFYALAEKKSPVGYKPFALACMKYKQVTVVIYVCMYIHIKIVCVQNMPSQCFSFLSPKKNFKQKKT